jgi:uncharacterized DUF497 family protein
MNGPQLEVTWDPAKAQSNITKLALTVFDEAHSDYEERWFSLGTSNQGRLLAVVHTYSPTGPNSAKVRIISAREATRHERRQYENEPR